MPFVCSGKFRLNAQKKRLDAWLIYRCAACDQTWNLPVLERCGVTEIDPAILQALTENCAALARACAFDMGRLRRHAPRIEPGGGIVVEKRLVGPWLEAPRSVAVDMAVPESGCGVRLDRLLAAELRVPRTTLRQLQAEGLLAVAPQGPSALRRNLRDGQVVAIDLAGLPAVSDLRPRLIAHVQ